MKVYAWLIDLIHRRKNCPTGMISGWVQKVTEHRWGNTVYYTFLRYSALLNWNQESRSLFFSCRFRLQLMLPADFFIQRWFTNCALLRTFSAIKPFTSAQFRLKSQRNFYEDVKLNILIHCGMKTKNEKNTKGHCVLIVLRKNKRRATIIRINIRNIHCMYYSAVHCEISMNWHTLAGLA